MKRITLSLIILISGLTSFAQPGGGMDPGKREEKIQALYVAFITKELSLTEDEAQKFWPVHGQYDNEIRSIRKESSEIEREEAMLNIKKKYQDRFSKILGAARTDEFYKKDREFRVRMVERLKNLRQQRINNGGERPFRRGGFQAAP